LKLGFILGIIEVSRACIFKKLFFAMTIILTLFVIGFEEHNNILIAGEDDVIEWNNYEIEDILS